MKKKTIGRIIAGGLAVLLILTTFTAAFTGCGKKEDGEESSEESSEGEYVPTAKDWADYVTLGDYIGLTVTAPPTEPTEEEIDDYAWQIYASFISEDNGGITDRAMEYGDTVYVHYTGTCYTNLADGVVLAEEYTYFTLEESADDDFLTEDLSTALLGAMPGETAYAVVEFPSDYNSSTMAGETVTFKIEAYYILPDEMDDEIIASFELSDITTVEELYDYAEEYLTLYMSYVYNSELEANTMDVFLETCTFEEFPEATVQYYRDALNEALTTDASYYGIEVDEYMEEVYGMSLEEFLDAFALESTMQEFAMQAVADTEGLNVTEDELDTLLEERAEAYGYDSVDEFLEYNGDREEYMYYFTFENVMEFLIENATIIE